MEVCKFAMSYLYFKSNNIDTTGSFFHVVSLLTGKGFEINLDKRKLKTPLGNTFRVPTEALALSVMTEWHAQQDTIKRHSMHMVRSITEMKIVSTLNH